MLSRRRFIQISSLIEGAFLVNKKQIFASDGIQAICQRPKISDRKFVSKVIEKTILQMRSVMADPELACLFENCFPNTLDTTVDFEIIEWKKRLN
jgi:hypothetical protein